MRRSNETNEVSLMREEEREREIEREGDLEIRKDPPLCFLPKTYAAAIQTNKQLWYHPSLTVPKFPSYSTQHTSEIKLS